MLAWHAEKINELLIHRDKNMSFCGRGVYGSAGDGVLALPSMERSWITGLLELPW